MADSRMIRSAILTSEKVNSLDWAAEVFYRRLMSIVDDFGLCDGRIGVLRGSLYSLQLHKVGDRDVEKWLDECSSMALVTKYAVDGKPYLKLEKFGQRIRDGAKPKFPLPPDTNPPPSAAIRGDPPPSAAIRGDPPPSAAKTQTQAQTNTQPQPVAGGACLGDPVLIDVANRSGWIDWEQIPSSERGRLIEHIRQMGAEKILDVLRSVPSLCRSKSPVSRCKWVLPKLDDIANKGKPKSVAQKLTDAPKRPTNFPEIKKKTA